MDWIIKVLGELQSLSHFWSIECLFSLVSCLVDCSRQVLSYVSYIALLSLNAPQGNSNYHDSSSP